ncbi:MAG: hypothetical protein KC422_14155 [Trueperaceae bacterium]|nr:hypothetical protein [Trueperaceae bacterium]
MKRLILLPENASDQSGYGIAVKADLARLKPGKQDTVIIYSETAGDYENFEPLFLKRNKGKKLERLVNVLRLKPASAISAKQLKLLLKKESFDEIICGEFFFYEPVKALFPDQVLKVRLHNFYTLLKHRQTILRYSLPAVFRFNLLAYSSLEHQLLRDPLVEPLFITQEELAHYQSVYQTAKGEVWSVLESKSMSYNPDLPLERKLVWFGSATSHKRYSLDYFIQEVFLPIREDLGLELHLYGSQTASLHAPEKKIFGHGFFDGEGLPMTRALYINPDLLGGGIKLKVQTLLEHGAAFISTAFGVEGYTLPRSEHIIIADIQDWRQVLTDYFSDGVADFVVSGE